MRWPPQCGRPIVHQFGRSKYIRRGQARNVAGSPDTRLVAGQTATVLQLPAATLDHKTGPQKAARTVKFRNAGKVSAVLTERLPPGKRYGNTITQCGRVLLKLFEPFSRYGCSTDSPGPSCNMASSQTQYTAHTQCTVEQPQPSVTRARPHLARSRTAQCKTTLPLS
jgi:hypothetical protein